MAPGNWRLSDEDITQLLLIARRTSLRWCRSPSEADDVAQEAVLRLLRQQILPSNARTWLFVVARRIAGRERARDQIRTQAECAFLAAQRSHRFDPDLFLDVGRVLSSMKNRDSRLLLRVLEGVGSQEIAAEFGCRTRDVGQMVARARGKARRTAGRSTVRKRPRRGS
jgi:RNA polymerase sigma factor (sigma-70 family)